MLSLLLTTTLVGCIATDGDSLRCGRERVRLLGIDAPELAPCPPRRRCAPGDPFASRDNLRKLVQDQTVEVVRIGADRYGRTLAMVHSAKRNLSCEQLRQGFAVYRRDWDNGKRVFGACPALAR